MTDDTVRTTKAKTAKHAASPFGLPGYDIPTFGLPNMEMPEQLRDMTEKGLAHSKDTLEKTKAAAEQATDFLKSTYTTASKGATDYNLKLFEIARINADAAFDYAQKLLGVKSPSELVELSTAHARKQLEAMTAQTKELSELAQKVTTEIAEPLKSGMTKAFNNKVA